MEFKNEKIVVNPEVFKADKEKSFREVLNYLQTEGIKHSVVEYFERKVIKTVGNVIIDFDDEEWSDTENKWIKSENHLNSKLIGFRTSIHDYS
jgi:hypothetical protein